MYGYGGVEALLGDISGGNESSKINYRKVLGFIYFKTSTNYLKAVVLSDA